MKVQASGCTIRPVNHKCDLERLVCLALPHLIRLPFCPVLSLVQLQGARLLGIPVIVSEQYPKGLGATVQEMDLTGAKLVFPKTKFSMVLPEAEAALADLPGVRSIVLFGVEVRLLLHKTY